MPAKYSSKCTTIHIQSSISHLASILRIFSRKSFYMNEFYNKMKQLKEFVQMSEQWSTWWRRLRRKWKKMGGKIANKARQIMMVRMSFREENLKRGRFLGHGTAIEFWNCCCLLDAIAATARSNDLRGWQNVTNCSGMEVWDPVTR